MKNRIKNSIVFILTLEARLVLWRHRPTVIAVTGNIGKTTTKDAIYAALSVSLYARKSEKSYNSEFGVPLAILGCRSGWNNPLRWVEAMARGVLAVVSPHYPKYLIVEVGADRPGDIRRIAGWLRPHVVVMTQVPALPVHVEFFDSPEALIHEKCALVEALRPGGIVVANGDDSRMLSLCKERASNVVTYGFDGVNDLQGSHEDIEYAHYAPIGIRFRANRHGASVPVFLREVLGRPVAYASLAAIAVGELYGIDLASASNALSLWHTPPGRMKIISGVRGSTIIDDTYNASPEAVLSALDTLKKIEAKRRIVIVGDMLELGMLSAEAHANVGKRVAGCADMLITVGFRARKIAESALDAGMRDMQIQQYEHSEAERAGREIEKELSEGDVVLIKGSQSMRMERTVLEIMAEPQRAEELLVRQDEEWLAI